MIYKMSLNCQLFFYQLTTYFYADYQLTANLNGTLIRVFTSSFNVYYFL